MIMTKTLAINGVANKETTQAILTSTTENHYHIKRLWITEVSTTPQNNAIIRAYRDLYLLTDFAYSHLLTNATSGTANQFRVIDVDVDLPVGSSYYVGHVSGSTASNMQYTVEYETITGA